MPPGLFAGALELSDRLIPFGAAARARGGDPPLKQPRQTGCRPPGGVEQHVVVRGLELPQAADDPDHPLHQVHHRVRHPVERGGVKREQLALRDRLGRDSTLDRETFRGGGVRLRYPDERLRELQLVVGRLAASSASRPSVPHSPGCSSSGASRSPAGAATHPSRRRSSEAGSRRRRRYRQGYLGAPSACHRCHRTPHAPAGITPALIKSSTIGERAGARSLTTPARRGDRCGLGSIRRATDRRRR